MNYELIDNITSADIAVRVKAPSYSLIFKYGAEALMSEIVEDISSIESIITIEGVLTGDDISLLYFDFLNEILYLKDAEKLLLLPSKADVSSKGGFYTCSYALRGEKIDRDTHSFKTDIKAVTLHGLKIYSNNGLFIAESVFDV